MKRREFISLLGGAAAAWPLAARAQAPAMPVIGYFSNRSLETEAYLLEFFRKGLAETGYVIDQSAAIELRFSEGREDLLPGLAADLVQRQVSVLVANDPASALAAKAATSTIPIVFASGRDPVELGLVASLNRPGGNATGVYGFVTELGPKRLHLLRELVPNTKLIAFIINPSSMNAPFQVNEMLAAAQAAGQDILVVNASNESEIEAAFATMIERKAGAIIYGANTWFQVIRERLVALTARHAIPAMYEWREFVTAGGLISYNTSRAETLQQMGVYAGRILKGARPGDLPVVQSSRFELAINLKTAKALGLEVPDKLLALADEVIE
jgi:putative ABC transport system substrate-binding protein